MKEYLCEDEHYPRILAVDAIGVPMENFELAARGRSKAIDTTRARAQICS